MTQTALTTIEGGAMSRSQFLPALSIQESKSRRDEMVAFVSECMVKKVDYGEIPGTGRDGKEGKPVLLKPGAEKLCTLFGLTPRFTLVDKVEDWTGKQHDGEPMFYYLYRCSLYRGDSLIAEGDGSCNTFESKYRYRKSERVCPQCGQPAIRMNRDNGSFYCWAKMSGCGAKFAAKTPEIINQAIGRIPNPDVCDAVNTVQKMSQKRALIAATLLAVNASEFFTQDLDDFLPSVPENLDRETGEILETTFSDSSPMGDDQQAATPESEEEEAARLKSEFEEAQREFRNKWTSFGTVQWPQRKSLIRLLCAIAENTDITAAHYLQAARCGEHAWKHALTLLQQQAEASAALRHAAAMEADPQPITETEVEALKVQFSARLQSLGMETFALSAVLPVLVPAPLTTIAEVGASLQKALALPDPMWIAAKNKLQVGKGTAQAEMGADAR